MGYLTTDKKDLIDVNLPDSLGMTPLMWACSLGHNKIVGALLTAGADLSLVDKSNIYEKITAYDYAKGYPNWEGFERHDDCMETIEKTIEKFYQTGKVVEVA